MNLPLGGYGVLGVCNDSAAFIDTALRGETNMYPLVSSGRFLFHSARRLLKLKEGLSKHPDMEDVLDSVHQLVTASCNIASDIHCSPSHLVEATRRYLANFPVSYFQLVEDSKHMMVTIAETYAEYRTSSMHDSKRISNFVDFLMKKGGARGASQTWLEE